MNSAFSNNLPSQYDPFTDFELSGYEPYLYERHILINLYKKLLCSSFIEHKQGELKATFINASTVALIANLNSEYQILNFCEDYLGKISCNLLQPENDISGMQASQNLYSLGHLNLSVFDLMIFLQKLQMDRFCCVMELSFDNIYDLQKSVILNNQLQGIFVCRLSADLSGQEELLESVFNNSRNISQQVQIHHLTSLNPLEALSAATQLSDPACAIKNKLVFLHQREHDSNYAGDLDCSPVNYLEQSLFTRGILRRDHLEQINKEIDLELQKLKESSYVVVSSNRDSCIEINTRMHPDKELSLVKAFDCNNYQMCFEQAGSLSGFLNKTKVQEFSCQLKLSGLNMLDFSALFQYASYNPAEIFCDYDYLEKDISRIEVYNTHSEDFLARFNLTGFDFQLPDPHSPEYKGQVHENHFCYSSDSPNVSIMSWGAAIDTTFQKLDLAQTELIALRRLLPFDTEELKNSLEKTGRLIIFADPQFSPVFANYYLSKISQEFFELLDAPVYLVYDEIDTAVEMIRKY